MIERHSHEPASLPDDDDGRAARLETRELLRVQLSQAVSERLERGSVAGQRGEIDNAEIAAFLDGTLPRAEWDAVAARLVNDPAARAELAAAVALLDEIEAQPATVPADLMVRAAGVLAGPEQDRLPVSAVTIAPAAGYRRPLAWPAFALAVLAVIAVPAIWTVVGDKTTAVEQGGSSDTFGRGIVAAPSGKKDAQPCVDVNSTTAPGTERRGETSADNKDRCAPKPPTAAKQERAVPAGSN
jgi:anti-sigma factor RsiW